MTAPVDAWLGCALGLASGLVAAIWMARISRPDAIAPPLTIELLEAMREVDEMLPGSPPITPSIRNVNGPWSDPPEPPPLAAERRAEEAAEKRKRRLMHEGAMELARLTGGPPLAPLPTRAPGPGMKGSH